MVVFGAGVCSRTVPSAAVGSYPVLRSTSNHWLVHLSEPSGWCHSHSWRAVSGATRSMWHWRHPTGVCTVLRDAWAWASDAFAASSRVVAVLRSVCNLATCALLGSSCACRPEVAVPAVPTWAASASPLPLFEPAMPVRLQGLAPLWSGRRSAKRLDSADPSPTLSAMSQLSIQSAQCSPSGSSRRCDCCR